MKAWLDFARKFFEQTKTNWNYEPLKMRDYVQKWLLKTKQYCCYSWIKAESLL